MSNSKTYFDALLTLQEEVNSAFSILSRKQSELDRQVTAIYHDIEAHDLDSDSGYAAAVCLQEVLRQRRVVKDEVARMSPLHRFLNDHTDALREDYRKRVEKSEEIRRTLNVTLTIEDVGL
ncbi:MULTISPECIES: hypothetical protein [unclassified Paenibacillus]|uniref:hypothetical protein n=1 Tax=unclassified Paenibacillus TaxID=185978 RepID=UPI0030F5FB4D